MRRRELLTGSAALGLSASAAHAFGIGHLGAGTGHLGSLGGVSNSLPPPVLGSTFNFVTNTATVNGVAQPSSVSSITDTRSTIGYDLAASTQFAINTPKRTSAGLLIENVSTNAVISSQAFNNTSWTKTGATVADNAAVAPDGTTTAALLTNTGTAGSLNGVGTIGVSNTVPFTATCFVKQGTAPFALLWISDGGTNFIGLFFNFSTNTYGSTAAGNEGVFDSSIPPVNCGNGWWRIGLRGHFTGNLSVKPFLFFTAANNALATVNGQTGLLWGYQFEGGTGSGTLVSTSYFPTTTAAATRAADAPALTTPSNAAKAVVTFSDSTTSTLPVPVNNQLTLLPANLSKTLLSSISIPAPATSYSGAVSTTSISYNPTGSGFVNISCKYTCAPFTVGVSSIKIVIPSWFVDFTGGTYVENPIGASFTVKASIESPPGTFTPITFGGVSTGTTVTPGTDPISDAVNVNIAAGATPNLWFYFVTDGTHGIPFAMFGANQVTSICNGSATPNDQTATGGAITSNMGGFTPLAIIGTTTKPTVMVVGDSRTRFPAGGQGGEVPRQLDLANLSYIDTGTPGERGSNYAASNTHRAGLNVYASHITNGYGINDLNIGQVTDSSLRATISFIMSLFPGKPQIITTLSPSTTSSFSIASLTSSGTLVTATASGAQFLSNGMTIVISGASPAAYNGSFVISNVVVNGTSSTFQYTAGSAPATSPATGTISGTDNWATLGNQTSNIPVAGALETHNAWRLTVPYPAVAAWDIASAVGQLKAGLLVWDAPGFTTDGLHGDATAMLAIGASGVVNTANLRL
jgi:hypothetical protein